jgi:hypothetical protein
MNLITYVASAMKKYNLCRPGDIYPLGGGMINRTFEVTATDYRKFIVQRMHPVFTEGTLENQDAVCNFLESQGLIAPSILRWWQDPDGYFWKITRHIKNNGRKKVVIPGIEGAAACLGKTHRVLSGFDYEVRPAMKNY